MATYDISPTGTEYPAVTIDDVIFTDTGPIGSGTGNYNTFLAISDNDGNELGFNSDDSNPLDPTNNNIDAAKTHTVLLSTVPITIINGVQYYEFRVDLNEPNNATTGQISLDAFKVYTSNLSNIESTTTLFNQTLVYDLDAGENHTILLNDYQSGSGADNYAVFVPVSKFGVADPATTYMYLYVEMGFTGGDYSASGGFEEWNLQKAGTLTGTKFADLDGDGVWDGNESGMAGVTIFIDTNKNGQLDAGERSTTTDADGKYTFYGVPLGTWQIDEVVPTDHIQTTGDYETATITTIGQVVTVDPIGNKPPTFSVSGTKYEDLTGNGKTGDDTGWTHGPVTIFIDMDGSGTLNDGDISTTTGANGVWSISGLTLAAVGKNIYEVVPGGSEQTGVPFQTVDNPGSGGTDTGNDFTNFRNFSVSGQKYEDLTGNGKTGDDTGWSHGAVTIFIDMDGSGTLNAGDIQTTTGANGVWSISGLTLAAVGKNIYEVVPGGSEQTGVLVQTVENPGSGGTDTGNDFTNVRTASLSGYKYNDLDGDGQRDGGEPGLEGWTIKLFKDGQDTGQTAITDQNGFYEFTNLLPGDYSTQEVLKPGWIQTDSSDPETLTSGENDTIGNDFGNFKKFCISGYKWDDTDGDGVWDDGELGIAGWTINLDKNNDGSIDATATTDANGKYKFGGLGPGVYKVTEENQDSWTPTFGGDGYVINGQSGTHVKGRSGYAETPNFGNHESDPGSAMTPGFWKNHPAIFLQETGYELGDKYESVFLVDVAGGKKYSGDPTLGEALGAPGGGEAALLRASTAAWANATSDDLHYCFTDHDTILFGFLGSTGTDPLDPNLEAKLAAVIDQLEIIDLNDDGCLSATEVIKVVQDVYDDNDATTDNWATSQKGTVAGLLDIMNNMPHIDAKDFI